MLLWFDILMMRLNDCNSTVDGRLLVLFHYRDFDRNLEKEREYEPYFWTPKPEHDRNGALAIVLWLNLSNICWIDIIQWLCCVWQGLQTWMCFTFFFTILQIVFAKTHLCCPHLLFRFWRVQVNTEDLSVVNAPWCRCILRCKVKSQWRMVVK